MTNKQVYTKLYKKLEKSVDEYGFFVCNEIEDLTNCNCCNFKELQLFNERFGGAWLSYPYTKSYHEIPKEVNEFKLTVLAFCIAMRD